MPYGLAAPLQAAWGEARQLAELAQRRWGGGSGAPPQRSGASQEGGRGNSPRRGELPRPTDSRAREALSDQGSLRGGICMQIPMN